MCYRGENCLPRFATPDCHISNFRFLVNMAFKGREPHIHRYYFQRKSRLNEATMSHENAPLWICSHCLQTKSRIIWNTLFKVLDKNIFQFIRYSDTPPFIIANVYVFCIFMIICTGCDLIVSRSRSQQSVYPTWRTSLYAIWLAG